MIGTSKDADAGCRTSALSFPLIPRGWYYACHRDALLRGPIGIEIGALKLVAFRDHAGRAAVLDAPCSHMGADLSRGCSVSGRLQCPLHGWEYANDGSCVHIPAGDPIPLFARQATFPTTELAGHVLFFNSPTPDYPMPFYDGQSTDDLVPAQPFDFIVNTPWHSIGANAFDLQHFRIAHDRALIDAPTVETPSPFARRITATFEVTGKTFRDRLTRQFSGPQVRMAITVWGGTNILVTATFRRTSSYGMVFVRPLDEHRSHLRTIVWVPRSRGTVGKSLIDPVDAWIRRRFIRAFMADDAARSDGMRYNPATLIDADQELSRYMTWLSTLTSAGR